MSKVLIETIRNQLFSKIDSGSQTSCRIIVNGPFTPICRIDVRLCAVGTAEEDRNTARVASEPTAVPTAVPTARTGEKIQIPEQGRFWIYFPTLVV